jgi:hypothetical protein
MLIHTLPPQPRLLERACLPVVVLIVLIDDAKMAPIYEARAGSNAAATMAAIFIFLMVSILFLRCR